MTIDGFNSCGNSKYYNVTKFSVTTSDGVLDLNAVVIDSLPSRINMLGRSELVQNLVSKGLVLADPTTGDDKLSDLGILVGVDYFFKLLGASQLDNNIYGIPSRVGTIVGGTIEHSNNVSCNQVTVLRIDPNQSLDDKLQRFWELDSINSTTHDSKVLSKFENSVSFDDGKYSVSLPWKENHPKLPSNYHYAKSRLQSTLNKLRDCEKDLLHYDQIIKDQLAAGFIEDVSDHASDSGKVHYLAHRGVKKDESSSTPLRIVYDCSANTKNNPSLNDCLYSGPNLINNLPDILLRIRIGTYAASSDIKKAFLNLRLNNSDRDSTRFLWPENPLDKNSKLLTYRFTSVLFGSTASPFLLNATVKHHLDKIDSDLSTELKENIYIDNLFVTSNNEIDLLQKKSESIRIFTEAGFSLHKFVSNSAVISDAADDSDNISNVLGMQWDVGADALSVTSGKLGELNSFTKRSVVSFVASVFDPLGFLLPLTIAGRLFIQDIWKSKIAWDDPISNELKLSLPKYSSDIFKVQKFTFPRCLTSQNCGELHVFSDASSRAYGSVAYLKTENSVDFIIAKCKIAPVNSKTLLELELSAVLLSVQLTNYIISVLNSKISFNNCTIWSDSSIALHWLNSDKCKRQFVKNRVDKIRNLSDSFLFNMFRQTTIQLT